jgi:hypothetical protein
MEAHELWQIIAGANWDIRSIIATPHFMECLKQVIFIVVYRYDCKEIAELCFGWMGKLATNRSFRNMCRSHGFLPEVTDRIQRTEGPYRNLHMLNWLRCLAQLVQDELILLEMYRQKVAILLLQELSTGAAQAQETSQHSRARTPGSRSSTASVKNRPPTGDAAGILPEVTWLEIKEELRRIIFRCLELRARARELRENHSAALQTLGLQ